MAAARDHSISIMGYPEKQPIDFSDFDIRRQLSPAAISGFISVANRWALTESQIRGLLGGIASSTLHAWKSNQNKRVLNQDTITRISLVVGIYKALHTYFGIVGDHWITQPNRSPLFGGAIPLEYMMSTGVIGMYEVRRLLDSWAAGH